MEIFREEKAPVVQNEMQPLPSYMRSINGTNPTENMGRGRAKRTLRGMTDMVRFGGVDTEAGTIKDSRFLHRFVFAELPEGVPMEVMPLKLAYWEAIEKQMETEEVEIK